MTRYFFIFIALISSTLFASTANALSEMEARNILISSAKIYFLKKDFANLEKISNDLRTNKRRTPSGTWQLSMFYVGIDEAIGSQVNRLGQDVVFKTFEDMATAWIQQYPNSPSAHITLSSIYIKHAWAYRGDGPAASVSPEAWAPFNKYIALAKQHLETSKSVAAVDPAWYTTMISVARNQNWGRDKFDQLLREALEREPLFYANYFSAIEYLMPKWHGSLQDIDNFAQNAVRRTSQAEGKSMYARIYWYASQSEFGDELFASSKVLWPRMKAGFDDMIAQYPDSWNLNNYAKFACLAGDQATTRQLFKRIGNDIVAEAWESENLLQMCFQKASH